MGLLRVHSNSASMISRPALYYYWGPERMRIAKRFTLTSCLVAVVCAITAITTLSWLPTVCHAEDTAQETPPQNPSQESITRQWVERWHDNMADRSHPDIQEAFPGGRSNRYHDAYVANFLREFGLPTTTNWRQINRQYAFDRDWFVVEWLYQAEDKKTGRLQREGTLFFGRVKDDRLIVSIEYFDRLVKGLERVDALPPFRADEMPFPWPDYDGLTRKYRPGPLSTSNDVQAKGLGGTGAGTEPVN
jgi:hypothetical protein